MKKIDKISEKEKYEIMNHPEDIQVLVDQITENFYDEVADAIDALLCMAGCKEKEDMRKMQIELVENGYDLVQLSFKDNPTKRFVYLTDIKNKFKKGYLVELDFSTGKISKKLIKSKVVYEQIIKGGK